MLPLQWQKGRQPHRLLCFSAAFFMVAVIFALLFVRVEELSQTMLLTGAAACFLAVLVVGVTQEDYGLFRSLFLGLLAGCLWCGGYSCLVWLPVQEYDGHTGEVRLELTEYAQSYTTYGVAYGVVTELDGEPCRLKVKAYLKDGSPDFAPGDVLTFTGELQAVERDLSRNLLQEGYFLTLSQESEAHVYPSEGLNLLRQMRILSRRITQRIGELLPGNEGALLSALLSGDREGFSDDFDRALTISGTRHITAVSGLHVTILAGILMRLLGKKAGLLVSVPAAVTYAAIVGFSPSVVRATILLVFWAAAFWLKQEKDSLTAMAAALLVLTAWNPFSALSTGLLLSFAATLGLILLSAPMNEGANQLLKTVKPKRLQRILHYVTGTVTATLAATVFTLPLNMLFFDTVPLLSLLSNLLILWAISLVMVLGIGILVISLFVPGAAVFLARWVVYWPLWWVVTVIQKIGTMRFAATDSANLLLAVCCLAALAAVLLWRGKLLSGKNLLAVVAVMICISSVFTAGERMLFGVVEIHNAGGQPVILLRSEGLSVLGCGAKSDIAAAAVDRAASRWNVAELETMLCTTGNYKSQSGLMGVLQRIPAERILLPSDDGLVSNVFSGVNVSTFTKSGTVTVSGVTIQLLRAGEETYALRLLANHFSLVSLCGLRTEEALTIVTESPCSADILLVDDRLANDWQVLLSLCEAVEPGQILVTSSGYSEHGESFGGIPLTLIDWGGVSFRFAR